MTAGFFKLEGCFTVTLMIYILSVLLLRRHEGLPLSVSLLLSRRRSLPTLHHYLLRLCVDILTDLRKLKFAVCSLREAGTCDDLDVEGFAEAVLACEVRLWMRRPEKIVSIRSYMMGP
jgi:hypothetical protein